MKKYAFIMLALIAFTQSALADWALQGDQSSINFVSVKANAVAEVSQFEKVAGTIDKQGNVKLSIDLASVDTGISIRDERMKKMLFEVSDFSHASLTGKVDVTRASQLKEGERYVESVNLLLSLHGVEKAVSAQVSVIKIANDQWQVSSLKPVIINAADHKLVKGVNKLRDLAGLSAISLAIPVTFNFMFE